MSPPLLLRLLLLPASLTAVNTEESAGMRGARDGRWVAALGLGI